MPSQQLPVQPILFVPHVSALLDYRRQAPAAAHARPTDEHLLPLYVALGAAGRGAHVERLHAGLDDHVLATDAFAFHPRAHA
jgi:4,5-DOPA dioxygenase extradiol